MIIPVKTLSGEYNIILEKDALKSVDGYLKLDRKVLIVTDDGVPEEYSFAVCKASKEPFKVVIKQGEQSKNFDNLKMLLEVMTKNNFTRTDCVVAVGGGVVGDLSGFAASVYMRGIDFYNIPTTLLSQVDSSIGGKTAVDFMGYKNIVGAFYQPKCVIIDPETLKTLSSRLVSNGLAESIKMAITSDKRLFEIFENENANDKIYEVIERSLRIKKDVVQKDEKESGLRRVLNFGHTLGHAVEGADGMQNFYHGECVAMGILPMCSEKIRGRVKNVLIKYSLPVDINFDSDTLISYALHDKKLDSDSIELVFADDIGKFSFKRISFSEYEEIIRKAAVL